MKNYYNYVYLDPRKPGKFEYDTVCFLFEPMYIGLGQKNRHLYHLRRKSHNSHLSNKIDKLKQIFQVKFLESFIVKMYDCSTKNEVSQYETELIRSIGRYDLKTGPLTNKTDGGEGLLECSEDVRKSKSEKLSGDKSYMYGKPKSEEVRRKISEALTGKPLSEDTIRKIKATTNSEEYKKRRYNEEWSKTASVMQKGLRACLWTLVDHNTGEIHKVKNLPDFCTENSLGYSALKNSFRRGIPVGSGPAKGWQLTERIDYKELA